MVETISLSSPGIWVWHWIRDAPKLPRTIIPFGFFSFLKYKICFKKLQFFAAGYQKAVLYFKKKLVWAMIEFSSCIGIPIVRNCWKDWWVEFVCHTHIFSPKPPAHFSVSMQPQVLLNVADCSKKTTTILMLSSESWQIRKAKKCFHFWHSVLFEPIVLAMNTGGIASKKRFQSTVFYMQRRFILYYRRLRVMHRSLDGLKVTKRAISNLFPRHAKSTLAKPPGWITSSEMPIRKIEVLRRSCKKSHKSCLSFESWDTENCEKKAICFTSERDTNSVLAKRSSCIILIKILIFRIFIHCWFCVLWRNIFGRKRQSLLLFDFLLEIQTQIQTHNYGLDYFH